MNSLEMKSCNSELANNYSFTPPSQSHPQDLMS